MSMSPALRRGVLTAHLACSVGWLGAVAGFLALALAGLSSRDAQVVRGAYLAADLITRFVIVPLSLGSLLTGLVQSLGTPWGLFRHYWVLATLLLNVLAAAALLVHTQPVGRVARAAAETPLASGDLRDARIELVVIASAALVVLLVATALSVYKPPGLTPYGWRKQQQRRASQLGSQNRTNRTA